MAEDAQSVTIPANEVGELASARRLEGTGAVGVDGRLVLTDPKRLSMREASSVGCQCEEGQSGPESCDEPHGEGGCGGEEGRGRAIVVVVEEADTRWAMAWYLADAMSRPTFFQCSATDDEWRSANPYGEASAENLPGPWAARASTGAPPNRSTPTRQVNSKQAGVKRMRELRRDSSKRHRSYGTRRPLHFLARTRRLGTSDPHGSARSTTKLSLEPPSIFPFVLRLFPFVRRRRPAWLARRPQIEAKLMAS